jgi:SPP1 gp7 family putative phage head morphogenesis protein
MKILTNQSRRNWLNQKDIIRGKPLLYPDAAASRYFRALDVLISAMQRESKREILKLYQSPKASKAGVSTQDAASDNFAEFAKRVLDRLLNKYTRIFERDLTGMVKAMLDSVNRSSAASLKASMQAMNADMIVSTDFLTGEMKEQFAALTQANVSLFVTIPEKHFASVEKAVMDSIITGNGMQDLVKFFEKHSTGERNYAYNRAFDQTRKAYSTVNAARMQKLGVKKFEWIHSGGANQPRKLHQEYDGKIFEFDKPPIIYYDKGLPVRGLPGYAVYCSCIARPVIELNEDAT